MTERDEHPDSARGPAERLAAARDHLAQARALLDRGHAHASVTRARQGLVALGDDYAAPRVEDDTTLKRLAAEDQVAAGNPAGGAASLLRVLEVRIVLAAAR